MLGAVKKKMGERATSQRSILRCLTQLGARSAKPTHALNKLRGLEVIKTTHCTVFVRPHLLILSHQARTWAGFFSAKLWTTMGCQWCCARLEPPLFLRIVSLLVNPLPSKVLYTKSYVFYRPPSSKTVNQFLLK